MPSRERAALGAPQGVRAVQGVPELRGERVRVGGETGGRPEDLAQHGQVADDHRDARRRAPPSRPARSPPWSDGKANARAAATSAGRSSCATGAEDHRLDAEFGGAGLPRGAVVAVVEERLAAGDDQPHVGTVRAQQRVRLEQVQRALAGLDAADGQHVAAEPGLPPSPAATSVAAERTGRRRRRSG